MNRGKIFLYTLIWWLLGFVLGSIKDGVIYDVVDRLEDWIFDTIRNIAAVETDVNIPLYSAIDGKRIKGVTEVITEYGGATYQFIESKISIHSYSEYALSFIIVLILSIIIEKKVWK